jgi:hypothetical protein
VNRRRCAAGRATLSGIAMINLLLPLTTIFCACASVVYMLALLDLLK